MPEDRDIRALRNFDDQGLIASLPVEILMELQSQLAHLNPDGTVLDRAIVHRLAKDRAADMVLSKLGGMAVDRTVCQVAKKFPQTRGLLEWPGCYDAFDQKPTLIVGQIVGYWGYWFNRHGQLSQKPFAIYGTHPARIFGRRRSLTLH